MAQNDGLALVLEADPERQLHRPALIDGAGDLIRVGHAAEVIHRVEVGIVEHVEDLGLTFDDNSLGQLDLLDEVHVEPDDLGPGDDEAADATIAESVDGLDTVRRVGGGEVAARGRAGGIAGGVDAERFDRVVDDVLVRPLLMFAAACEWSTSSACPRALKLLRYAKQAFSPPG